MDGEDTDASVRDVRDGAKTLGTAKISRGGRISLVEGVREAFADRGVDGEEGDRLAYALRDGHVVVDPDEVPPNR